MNQESFNEKLCSYLENYLGEAFGEAEQQEVKGLWCDGVLMPVFDNQLTKKSVNDTRKIITTAFIGYSDTHNFTLVIRFGKYALRRYAKGVELIDCLAVEHKMNRIKVDVDNRTIELQLK